MHAWDKIEFPEIGKNLFATLSFMPLLKASNSDCEKDIMKKVFALILALPVLLTACAPATVSPYAYDGKQPSVVGQFCPPKEAIKGNC